MSKTFKEKKLFTPGPLGVSPRVRQATNRDMGSRDPEFIQIIHSLQLKLIEIAGFTSQTHACVLMQGSGTFSVEATLRTTSNLAKKVLILSSGAYGLRMESICKKSGIGHETIVFPEDQPVKLDERIKARLDSDEFGILAMVHCETTSGVFSEFEEIGIYLKSNYPSIFFILDAMSSFGGVDADFGSVDFLISSANKCLQGIPGFGFVICRKECLAQCKDRCNSLSLDLYDQWRGFESNGQFRFTPPTHCILALTEAILELEEEGGVAGRAQRYKQNNQIVKAGMREFGFERFVPDAWDGYIITSYKFPVHPDFGFEDFYNRLSLRDQLIYPGKVTNADCFRIGNIGDLHAKDMKHLLLVIKEVLIEMGIPV